MIGRHAECRLHERRAEPAPAAVLADHEFVEDRDLAGCHDAADPGDAVRVLEPQPRRIRPRIRIEELGGDGWVTALERRLAREHQLTRGADLGGAAEVHAVRQRTRLRTWSRHREQPRGDPAVRGEAEHSAGRWPVRGDHELAMREPRLEPVDLGADRGGVGPDLRGVDPERVDVPDRGERRRRVQHAERRLLDAVRDPFADRVCGGSDPDAVVHRAGG